MDVAITYTKSKENEATEQLNMHITNTQEAAVNHLLVELLLAVKGERPVAEVQAGDFFTEQDLTAAMAEIEELPDIEVVIHPDVEAAPTPAPPTKRKTIAEQVKKTDTAKAVSNVLTSDLLEERKQLKNILPGVTEKKIDVLPIHDLRRLVANTHWMNIPKYGKMPADKLRKQMKAQLTAYKNASQSLEK